MGEPQPKKVVGRSVVIALGLVCAILATGLVGAIIYYTSVINQKDLQIADLQSAVAQRDSQISSLQSQVSNLSTQISDLNNQLTDLQNTINQKNSQIVSLQRQITDLNARIVSLQTTISQKDSQIAELLGQIFTLSVRVSELEAIVNLEKVTVIADHSIINQPPSSVTTWSFTANYAGYVVIQIHSSTTDKTYVEVVVSSNVGAFYKLTWNVGSSGTVVAPVLPGSVQIRVGNTNILSGATMDVSIKYCY